MFVSFSFGYPLAIGIEIVYTICVSLFDKKRLIYPISKEVFIWQIINRCIIFCLML